MITVRITRDGDVRMSERDLFLLAVIQMEHQDGVEPGRYVTIRTIRYLLSDGRERHITI